VIPALMVIVVAAGLGTAGDAAAASFSLGEADKRAAVQAGERSTLSDAFDREWRVSGGGGDSLTVLTPFHRLLLAARHAAFKRTALKPAEIERVLRQDAQRLVVWVQLHGPAEDFARHYVPRLVDGPREIRPSFVQNERTAMRQGDGGYLARCVYAFPIRDLDGRRRVVLSVSDADGRDVSQFTIDLASMR
jgi:hypothetical protein